MCSLPRAMFLACAVSALACSSLTVTTVKGGRLEKSASLLVCPWPAKTSEWFVSEFQLHPHGELPFDLAGKKTRIVIMPKDGSDAADEKVCEMARFSLSAAVRLDRDIWKAGYDAVLVSLPMSRKDYENASRSVGRPSVSDALAEAVEKAGQAPEGALLEKFSTTSCASSYLAVDRIWNRDENCAGIVYLGPRNKFRPVLYYQTVILDGRTAEPLAKFRGEVRSVDHLRDYAGFVAGLFR